VREARIDYYAGQLSQKELNESLIDIVIKGMVKQVASESLRLNDLAIKKSFDLVTRALK